jgi:putative ABC transport system substrate-binding protein
MRRREFIAGLALPFLPHFAVRSVAQGSRHFRLVVFALAGNVSQFSETSDLEGFRAFFGHLRSLGYAEGGNLIVERRSGEGRPEKVPEIAREIVALHPDVLFTTSIILIRALRAASYDKPIVFVLGDPVAMGLVASLAKPGANMTGASIDAGLEIFGKYVEILRSLRPGLARLAYVASALVLELHGRLGLADAASNLGVTIVGDPVQSPFDDDAFDRAFANYIARGADALLISNEPATNVRLSKVIALANFDRLPTLFTQRAVRQGGLINYALDVGEIFRASAEHVDRIFRGSSPADLPIYRPTRFQLGINLKTAHATGITIPESLLARADEVIE